jgi:hypothetical protein
MQERMGNDKKLTAGNGVPDIESKNAVIVGKSNSNKERSQFHE